MALSRDSSIDRQFSYWHSHSLHYIIIGLLLCLTSTGYWLPLLLRMSFNILSTMLFLYSIILRFPSRDPIRAFCHRLSLPCISLLAPSRSYLFQYLLLTAVAPDRSRTELDLESRGVYEYSGWFGWDGLPSGNNDTSFNCRGKRYARPWCGEWRCFTDSRNSDAV